jgi:hypothetical protein
MVTKSEIEEGLATYIDDMKRCAATECNSALVPESGRSRDPSGDLRDHATAH